VFKLDVSGEYRRHKLTPIPNAELAIESFEVCADGTLSDFKVHRYRVVVISAKHCFHELGLPIGHTECVHDLRPAGARGLRG
jgi:hypothetical protein